MLDVCPYLANRLAIRISGCCRAERLIIVAIVLSAPMAASSHALAAEGRWFNFFGEDDQPTESESYELDPMGGGYFSADRQPDEPLLEEEEPNWLITSPFGKVSWPQIRLPTFQLNPPWRNEGGEREGWLARPFSRVRSTARGAVVRTQTAWNNTIDRMKIVLPGGGSDSADDVSPQLAAETQELGFWERFLGPQPPADEPEAVVEMMAEERMKTRR